MHNRHSRNSKAGRIEQFARQQRCWPTESEARLWSALKGGQLGVGFRRQVPLGRFIADFLAPSVGLVVEVDGGHHSPRAAADERRDVKLQRLGYRVVRVSGELVVSDLGAALTRVRAAL